MIPFLKNYGLYLAWIISIIATGGSLYFSEILGWIPCDLCWYQRIFMYPLVILLGITTYQDDRTVPIYFLPLTIIGGGISIFHYLQQKIPALAGVKTCQSGVPCNMQYMDGIITIPFLAFLAFFLITICLLIVQQKKEDATSN